MKRLGLQYAVTSGGFNRLDNKININEILVNDKRELLKRFNYPKDRRVFFYFLSFSSQGLLMDIVLTRVGERAGDNDSACLFIPSGILVEPRQLASLVETIKEELRLGPVKRIPIQASEYLHYFTKDYEDQQYPVFPDPISDRLGVVRFGTGTDETSLLRVFSNLYYPIYANFKTIALANQSEGIEILSTNSEDLTLKRSDKYFILRRIEVQEGEKPSAMMVDGVPFLNGIPVFVKSVFSLRTEHPGFLPCEMKVPYTGDEVVTLPSVDWKFHLDMDSFTIRKKDYNLVPREYVSITVNGKPLFPDLSLTIPVKEAKNARLRVSAEGFQPYEQDTDLTSPRGRVITLEEQFDTVEFYINDVTNPSLAGHVHFPLRKRSGATTESPVKGYVVSKRSGRFDKYLDYDRFGFLKNTVGIACVAGALLFGIGGGWFLGRITAPKTNAASFEGSRYSHDQDRHSETSSSNEDALQDTKDSIALFKALIDESEEWDSEVFAQYDNGKEIWGALNNFQIDVLEKSNKEIDSQIIKQVINTVKEKLDGPFTKEKVIRRNEYLKRLGILKEEEKKKETENSDKSGDSGQSQNRDNV